MKEIRYDGDLYGNICEDKEKNGVYYGYMIFFVIAAISGMVGTLFGRYDFSAVVYISGAVLASEHRMKVNAKNKIKKAIYKMKKDANIDVSHDELQKAILIQNEKISRLKCGKNMSREEKIIKYFQFLDKQDQIQILKQVQTVIGKQNIDNELYLLEDEDLEKEGLQYIRK